MTARLEFQDISDLTVTKAPTNRAQRRGNEASAGTEVDETLLKFMIVVTCVMDGNGKRIFAR